MDTLQKQLMHGNAEEKMAALKALVRASTKEAGKILVSAMKQESDEDFKKKIKKGIEHIKVKLAEKSLQPVQKLKTAEMSVEDWLKSGDPEMEKLALQHIYKSKDRELLELAVKLSSEQGSNSFCKGTLKLIERLLPDSAEELLFPFLCHKEEEIAVMSMKFLVFSRSIHKLATREDYLSAQPVAKLKKAASWLDTAHGNDLPAELRMSIKSIIHQLERPKIQESRVVIDPDLLPKTRDQAQVDDSKTQAERQKKITQINRARNELEQSEDKAKILELFSRLVELQDQGATESIVQKIAVSKDPEVIEKGIEAIAASGREAGINTLNSYSEHTDKRVRTAVAKGYRIMMAGKSMPLLERMLKDPEESVIAEAIIGLYPEKETLCFVPLSTLVNSPKEPKAIAGLYAIKNIGQDKLLLMVHKAFKTRTGKVQEYAKQVIEDWRHSPELRQAGLSMSVEEFTQFLRSRPEKKPETGTTQAENVEQSESEVETDKKQNQPQTKGIFGSILGKLVKR
ncbi:MAG: HEAT repeat domain-containing protein [Candidatus Cloacimonetes bacterium]|nr:HEAT repeat domain-containing protein [Candidatus Cloacimonadota bacterium]